METHLKCSVGHAPLAALRAACTRCIADQGRRSKDVGIIGLLVVLILIVLLLRLL